MARRPFKNFLLSGNAIQVHLLCITLIVVLSISIWEGNAQPDYKWGLLFTIIAYPIVLWLLWANDSMEQQAAVEHIVESLTEPEQLRRKQRRWRGWSLTGLFAVSAFLAVMGKQGWELNGVPTQYIGYFLFAFAMLGAFGVNIWYGGPLDQRNDPPVDVDSESPNGHGN